MTKLVINTTRFIVKDALYASLIPLAQCHRHALVPGFSFIPLLHSLYAVIRNHLSFLCRISLICPMSQFQCHLSEPSPYQVPYKLWIAASSLVSSLLIYPIQCCQIHRGFHHLLPLIRTLHCCLISDHFKSGLLRLLTMSLAR